MGIKGRYIRVIVDLLLAMAVLCGTTSQRVAAKNMDLCEEIQSDVKPSCKSS